MWEQVRTPHSAFALCVGVRGSRFVLRTPRAYSALGQLGAGLYSLFRVVKQLAAPKGPLVKMTGVSDCQDCRVLNYAQNIISRAYLSLFWRFEVVGVCK